MIKYRFSAGRIQIVFKSNTLVRHVRFDDKMVEVK